MWDLQCNQYTLYILYTEAVAENSSSPTQITMQPYVTGDVPWGRGEDER